ncbi:DUF4166 domain-containing protein [Agrococcus jejuensis]|uniref:DUF4166 domain-containing protein n=1 Tax=Agrococcus jejuensis TaxID=399736 RepID=A0A1G8EU40_9MICO|nr:DUF4166 domain-containing protein [Agrococcus jejuensis]SDH73423.1 protein of unknown function [Agrococcus jejuensis]
MRADLASPYERAIGDRARELHPTLQRYFSTIPEGSVGIGEGTFACVGTPRRWLWPALRLLQGRGVAAATWARDVPFRVRNRTVAGRAVAERILELPTGTWTMRDAVHRTARGTLVDVLGTPATLAAAFALDVRDGALHLTSTRVGVRVGRLRVPIPRAVAPVVALRERYDEATGLQEVSVTVAAPLVGRIFEYRGTFAYRIEQEAA